ncbi:putative lipase domain protein [Trypanosoma conorhini]|uniref:Putative lipase domain protein n=1 Tax=Trypanosoma conorhini TaxID=83891 RepID=A0A3R7NQS6_9TRYP|nr:putative lipase domain protein [Trypanosoma conorhini]RNF25622.1 putative lipase domain protein [Trypanosoma conorhini]
MRQGHHRLSLQQSAGPRAAGPADVSAADSAEADAGPSARGHEERPSESLHNAVGESCGQKQVKCVIPRAPRRNLHLIRSHAPAAAAPKKERGGPFCFSRGFSSEPVELQIEGLSFLVGRATLYLWYSVIISAAVVQSMDFLAWGLVSICGEEVADLRHYDKWTSPCVTSTAENTTDGLYTIRWEGGPYKKGFDDSSVRFTRVVLSLANAEDWGNGTETVRSYNITAVIPYDVVSGDFSALSFTVTCTRKSPRCSQFDLPAEVVLNNTSTGRKSLTLIGVPAPLARVVGNSSVGVVFQKYAYSQGVFIWRYLFLLLSFLHFLRFIVYKKFTSTLHEQSWVVVLQLALFWYLNPLYALNYSKGRPSLVLHFLESHFPTWFVAVYVGFMLSAITATMPWTPPTYEQQPGVYNILTLSGIKGYFCHSATVYDPPLWTKWLVVAYVLVIIVLDIVGESLHAAGSLEIWGDPLHSIHYAVAVLLLLGCAVCCVLLVHVHRNMGAKSYLNSRPQQLASRFLILIFVTSLLYFVFHIIIFFLRYRTIPGMTVTQPMIQLPALMVSVFLVNIMTLIYTTRKRGDLVPVHPRDERWKLMVWPDTWYRWLSRHGGSMYIFHTEAEELTFNWNQIGYRKRQYKAKTMRRRGRWSGASILRRALPRALAQRLHHSHADAEPAPETPEACSAQANSCSAFASLRTESREHPTILNMDRTSTMFLPTRTPRNAPFAGRQGLHSQVSFREGNESEAEDRNFESLTERQSTDDVPLREAEGRRGRPAPPQLAPGLQNSLACGAGEAPFAASETSPIGPQRRRHARAAVEDDNAAAAAQEEAEDSKEDDGYDLSRNMASRTFGRAREKMDSLMRGAERTFISRPLDAFEHFETFVLEAAARPFREVDYLPFFNLETAIGCFNLSWEAYGTSHRGEGGVLRRRPFSLSRLCCSCCSAADSSSDGEVRVPIADSEAPAATARHEPHPCEDEGGNRVERSAQQGQADPNAPPPIDVERYGYRLCAVLEAMDVQVVISALDSADAVAEGKAPRIVIAFRGTMSMSNAWQDLRVRRVVWDEMVEGEPGLSRDMCCETKPTVHVGFLSIWNAHREHVCGKLWEELSANPSTVYRVYCTGHSLGGALATLCAYSVCGLLRRNNYALAEVTVYTFGQPPLGNKVFQTAYNKAVPRTFRVVNESDLVGSISMYGSHIGVEVDIDRHGNYICKPTYMEQLFRPMKGKGFAVENHLMESYSVSLNAVAKGTSCPSVAYAREGDGGGGGGDHDAASDGAAPGPSETEHTG